ncbi:MAG: type II secretion system F family protein [Candidatus Hodarchaeales archaeon]
MIITKKTQKIVAVASFGTSILFLLGIFLTNNIYKVKFVNEIFLVTVLIIIIPITIVDRIHQRWLNAIKDQMPYFVRGLSESQNIGVTIIESFEYVVNNDLIQDPLRSEIESINTRISWGQTFEESLLEFIKKVDSPFIKRFSVLLLEIHQTGGNIQEAFLIQSEFMEDMSAMDQEASSQMIPYVVIIYIAYFVFITTSIILLNSFFKPLEELSSTISMGLVVSITQFTDFFYQTMLVSGLMSGLMAGKIGELRVLAGLKHSIVLLILGYLTFFVMIPPNWVGVI